MFFLYTYVCTVYRPPDCTLQSFDQEFSESFISASALNKDIYILGDLNCNILNSSDSGAKALLDFCSAFNLSQIIDQPTRSTKSSKTLIDVVLVTNKNMLKNSGVMPISISDHDLVYITLNFKKRRPKPVYIMRHSLACEQALGYGRREERMACSSIRIETGASDWLTLVDNITKNSKCQQQHFEL